MRKIPLKNYIILVFLTVAVFILVIYLRNLYLNKKNYENNSNSTMSFLKEVREDELDNFITENPDFILYVSDANNEEISEFENNLRDKLVNEDYIKNMVYLNTNVNNVESINKYLTENVKIEDIPSVMVIKDEKIVSVYYPKNDGYEIDKIVSFIEMNLDGNE